MCVYVWTELDLIGKLLPSMQKTFYHELKIQADVLVKQELGKIMQTNFSKETKWKTKPIGEKKTPVKYHWSSNSSSTLKMQKHAN